MVVLSQNIKSNCVLINCVMVNESTVKEFVSGVDLGQKINN